MPDLFQFDDFEKCSALSDINAPVKYCVVRTFIKPDKASQLYKFIHEFSEKEKQHFRHDKLDRGICMTNCEKLVEDLGDEAENYFIESFPMDSKLTFDFIGFPFVARDRLKYNRIVNICINKHLVGNYNLTGFSSIEYCLGRDRDIPAGD